jgi:hypothetical protein
MLDHLENPMIRFFLFISFVFSLFSQLSGHDVIQKMHERYKGQWYKTLTFEQKTTFLKGDSISHVQTWHEAISLPGQLHVKFGDPEDGNGLLFSADSQFVYKDHKLINRSKKTHPLLLLGFDVYGQATSKTIEQLKALGFNLDIVHQGIWQNRPVYVVGAEDGDLQSMQFWIDVEHLYFVRSISYNKKYNVSNEVEFNRYVPHQGGWVAPEVIFKRNGVTVMIEEYSNVKSPKLFIF